MTSALSVLLIIGSAVVGPIEAQPTGEQMPSVLPICPTDWQERFNEARLTCKRFEACVPPEPSKGINDDR